MRRTSCTTRNPSDRLVTPQKIHLSLLAPLPEGGSSPRRAFSAPAGDVERESTRAGDDDDESAGGKWRAKSPLKQSDTSQASFANSWYRSGPGCWCADQDAVSLWLFSSASLLPATQWKKLLYGDSIPRLSML